MWFFAPETCTDNFDFATNFTMLFFFLIFMFLFLLKKTVTVFWQKLASANKFLFVFFFFFIFSLVVGESQLVYFLSFILVFHSKKNFFFLKSLQVGHSFQGLQQEESWNTCDQNIKVYICTNFSLIDVFIVMFYLLIFSS